MTSKFLKAKRVVQKVRAESSPSSRSRATSPAGLPGESRTAGARQNSRVPAVVITPGVCRYCGCTEEHACALDDGLEVRGCWWIDKQRTVCSNPECRIKWLRNRARKGGAR